MLGFVNTWLAEHQIIVVSVIIPAFSAIISYLSARAGFKWTLAHEDHKNKNQKKLQDLEFRRKYYNMLMGSSVEFAHKTFICRDLLSIREVWRSYSEVMIILQILKVETDQMRSIMCAMLFEMSTSLGVPQEDFEKAWAGSFARWAQIAKRQNKSISEIFLAETAKIIEEYEIRQI